MRSAVVISTLLLAGAWAMPTNMDGTVAEVEKRGLFDALSGVPVVGNLLGGSTSGLGTVTGPITNGGLLGPITDFLNTLTGNLAGIKATLSALPIGDPTQYTSQLLQVQVLLNGLLTKLHSTSSGITSTAMSSGPVSQLSGNIGNISNIQNIVTGLQTKLPGNTLLIGIQSTLANILVKLAALNPTPVSLPVSTATSNPTVF